MKFLNINEFFCIYPCKKIVKLFNMQITLMRKFENVFIINNYQNLH